MFDTDVEIYSVEGKVIDKLLLTEGDYIEKFYRLGSKLTKNTNKKVLYKTNFDIEPFEEKILKRDTLTINKYGKF
jgi:hypothetical protein